MSFLSLGKSFLSSNALQGDELPQSRQEFPHSQQGLTEGGVCMSSATPYGVGCSDLLSLSKPTGGGVVIQIRR